MTDHVDPTAANLARFGIARTSRGDAIRAKCMDWSAQRTKSGCASCPPAHSGPSAWATTPGAKSGR